MQKAVWFHWRLAALALSGRVACLVAVLVLLYDRHTSCEQNACIALITAAEDFSNWQHWHRSSNIVLTHPLIQSLHAVGCISEELWCVDCYIVQYATCNLQ